MKRICFLIIIIFFCSKSLFAAGCGTTPVENTNATPINTQLSSNGWWATFRNSQDIVTVDSAITESILTSSGTLVRRITGISMAMWCTATWQILLNNVVVYVGSCTDTLNYVFGTPIPVPINTTVKLRYTLVKDYGSCKLWYTVSGDTQVDTQ